VQRQHAVNVINNSLLVLDVFICTVVYVDFSVTYIVLSFGWCISTYLSVYAIDGALVLLYPPAK
jgi:hypothetical protein